MLSSIIDKHLVVEHGEAPRLIMVLRYARINIVAGSTGMFPVGLRKSLTKLGALDSVTAIEKSV